MTRSLVATIRRHRYGVSAADQGSRIHAERFLPLLLAQDGSTTRLCETIAGGPVELQLIRQTVTTDVPGAGHAQSMPDGPAAGTAKVQSCLLQRTYAHAPVRKASC